MHLKSNSTNASMLRRRLPAEGVVEANLVSALDQSGEEIELGERRGNSRANRAQKNRVALA